MDAVFAANLLCALIYLVLGILLAKHSAPRPTLFALVAACIATGVHALAAALDWGNWLELGPVVGVLWVCRAGAWIAFLALACEVGTSEGNWAKWLRFVCLPAGAICLLLIILELTSAAVHSSALRGGAALTARLSGQLLLVIAGLLLVEALLRGTTGGTRWRVRYLCIGVGGVLVYDVFLCSDALVYRRIDPSLEASRGAVAAIAAPLIAIAAARNQTWETQVNLARRAVYDSLVLVGVGLYLISLGAAAAFLRTFGGDWTRFLQATFVFSALLLLAVLASSKTLRLLMRRRLSQYLFTHRHDYRETWRHFTESLSRPAEGAPLRQRALQAVADIVQSRGGGLWLRESDAYVRVAGRAIGESGVSEPLDGEFIAHLEHNRYRILQLGTPDAGGGVRDAEWVPDWLRRWDAAWLVVPLAHRDELIGFIILEHAAVRSQLDAEDEDLLQMVSGQTASYLAEERNTVALEEAQRFDELARGLAFMAHDLRNLANSLSLTLSNARHHIQNPEYQRELLQSMEESVAAMQRLLERLRSGKPTGARSAALTDLARLVRDSLRTRFAAENSVRLDLDGETSIPVSGDPDRLMAVSGHLIQNAIDATGADGEVIVRLHREGDTSILEILDDGPGMTPEFLQARLLHPFRSSKANGFGIGLYECRDIARQLGGWLAIESVPGCGTVARLSLPIVGDGVAEANSRRGDDARG